jgi:hypothetical protein
LLADQVPSWPGVTHHRFVAIIGGGVSVAKAQHPLIADVGPSTSAPFPNRVILIYSDRKIGNKPQRVPSVVIFKVKKNV